MFHFIELFLFFSYLFFALIKLYMAIKGFIREREIKDFLIDLLPVVSYTIISILCLNLFKVINAITNWLWSW